ncbi:MAG: M50 family metallopeptidase [candidate division Zixibacteria bacterium]|nr:M50 family metallopeptidase [candidate division Zixibacteria bacterium]
MNDRIKPEEIAIAKIDGKPPKRLLISETARHPLDANTFYYVIRNLKRDRYIRLSEPYYRLFLSMDGITPPQSLCKDIFKSQNVPNEQTLRQFLNLLLDTGLIEWDTNEGITQNQPFETKPWPRIVIKIICITRRILGISFSLKNSDHIAQRIYSLIGWLLRNQIGQVAVLSIISFGLVFAPTHSILSILATPIGQPPENVTRTYFALCLPFMLVSMLFHEAGHCIACKHYRRYVPAIGIRLFLGFPAPYVDTTDCWMLPQGKRMIVAAAGIMANGFLMGLSSILILALSNSEVSYAAKLLFLINLAAMAINIMPFSQYDGYRILCDLLDEPHLRKADIEYIAQPGIWTHITGLRNLSRRDILLAAYGISSLIFNVAVITAIILLLALISRRIGLCACAT